VIVFAEKGSGSSADRTPTQQHYRPSAEREDFYARTAVICAAARPHLARSTAPLFCEPPPGYVYIDREFQVQREPPRAPAALPARVLARARRMYRRIANSE
jgi:hypothetical protein